MFQMGLKTIFPKVGLYPYPFLAVLGNTNIKSFESESKQLQRSHYAFRVWGIFFRF